MYNDRQEEMKSPEYRAFRFGVFSRDNWTCVKCSTKGKHIEAHHIRRWADEPRLRYMISNGVTLCKDCHGQVTGKEEVYEEEFKKVVAFKKQEQMARTSVAGKKKASIDSPRFKALNKWRPRNPRNRY